MVVNLILFQKDGSMLLFTLPSAVTSIGRYRGCDFCIPSTVVSRKHCELYIYQGKLMVRDLLSRNGTFLNGEQVDEAHVQAGDILEIGPVILGVQIDGNPKDIESMRPKDRLPRAASSVPKPIEQPDDAFEGMIKDLSSDFDLNQTLNADQGVDVDSL
jgi:pSer/pThr/pTyr-binding forkhead associated (FHA) protein